MVVFVKCSVLFRYYFMPMTIRVCCVAAASTKVIAPMMAKTLRQMKTMRR
jgi:hypothetical protein